MTEKLIYLICPVNEVTVEEQKFLDNYVKGAESEGCRVHYPPRDVNQTDPLDPSGLKILLEHRRVMKEVPKVRAYLGKKTRGSYFDLGMAFMGEKPLSMVNPAEVLTRPLDDFDKFVLSRADNIHFESNADINHLKFLADMRKADLRNCPRVEYEMQSMDKQFFFDFGMAFYTRKSITLVNREYAETLRTPNKSFQNVLLELDKQYRKAL